MRSVADIEERSVGEHPTILAVAIVREHREMHAGGIRETENLKQMHRRRRSRETALGTGAPRAHQIGKRTILCKRREEISPAIDGADSVPGEEPCRRPPFVNNDREVIRQIPMHGNVRDRTNVQQARGDTGRGLEPDIDPRIDGCGG